MRKTFSLVIPIYGDRCILEYNLDLLASDRELAEHEVIIVNDNPSVSLDHLASSNVRVISNTHNSGHSKSCDVGIFEARGEFLIILDSDVLMTIKGIKSMTAYASKGTAHAILLKGLGNNLITHCGVGYYEVETIKPFRYLDALPTKVPAELTCQTIHSTAMVAEAQILREVGGFEEILYNSYADYDLSMKLSREGAALKVITDEFMYHRGKSSGNIRMMSLMQNKALFFKNWGHEIENDYLKYFRLNLHEIGEKIGGCLVVDFSDSIFSKKIITEIQIELSLDIIDVFKYRNSRKNKILLEEWLPLSLLSTTRPIIFFCDSFIDLDANSFWVEMREGKSDYIIDFNGVVCPFERLKQYRQAAQH